MTDPMEEIAAAMAPLRERLAQELGLRLAIATEAEVRRMLGCWVSELEPVLLYSHHGGLVGLTYAGILPGLPAPVCVRARPIHLDTKGMDQWP